MWHANLEFMLLKLENAAIIDEIIWVSSGPLHNVNIYRQ